MKKLLLPLLILLFSHQVFAQFDCSDGRFDNEDYFSDVDVTENITFGENDNPTLLNPNFVESLEFDIYEPMGDLSESRPMVMLAFGGSFIAGNRKSPDVVELCNRFARAGYVAVSIDYRLTTDLLFNSSEMLANRAVMKGLHDMKAAVRYFRKDISENNTYKIHPDHIYVGGVSAGGFIALHTAYLNKEEEIPADILQETTDAGGLEGTSGTPDYDSHVNGVINLAGAIGDTSWIELGNVPVVSAHGDLDGTVPFGAGAITLLNLNYEVFGSSAVHDKADELGIANAFYPQWGQDHVPFVSNELYMDSTFTFVKEFMLPIVCAPVALEDEPTEAFNASIYPNPAFDNLHVRLDQLVQNMDYELYDINGKLIRSNAIRSTVFQIERKNLMPGFYVLRINSPEGYLLRKLVFQ